MEPLSALPDGLAKDVATVVFALLVAVMAARSYFGAKKAPEPKTVEFGITGQLTDMGPVKELIANTGLLVIQQTRTSVALERFVTAYEGQLAKQRTDEEEQDRKDEILRLAKELKEEMDRADPPHRRRTAPRTEP